MADEITFNEDILDSRDIIERLEELEEAQGDWLEEHEDLSDEDWAAEYPDEAEELSRLQEVASQCSGYGDWLYGETLIRDGYFTDYVEELVRDIGDLPKEIPHYIVIDWDATAENIKVDYMSVTVGGRYEYYMRRC